MKDGKNVIRELFVLRDSFLQDWVGSSCCYLVYLDCLMMKTSSEASNRSAPRFFRERVKEFL